MMRSIDPEFKDQQRAAINARQVQKRLEDGKIVDNPWECFVRRKIKNRYPWQSFDEQDRIIPTPTRTSRP